MLTSRYLFFQPDNRIFVVNWTLSLCGGSVGMGAEDPGREKEKIWESLCRECGWVCRICGEVPEEGQQFVDNLCDDCRKMTRNE
jgi:hypothetical protein